MRDQGTTVRTREFDRPIQVRVPERLYDEIKDRAKAETVGISAWIRRACLVQLRKKSLG